MASMFIGQPLLAAEQQSEPEQVTEEETWDEAAKVVEPKVERQKVDVSNIDAEDFQFGVFVGQMNVEDFGTNSLVGGSIAYHITEDIFTSITFGTTDTEPSSFEVISGSDLLTESQRKLTFYDINVGINLLPGESFVGESTSFNNTFYALFGIGATDFAGDNRFTYNVGVGYQITMDDWFAMHIEVRDHIFDIDILGTDKTTHNINYNIGFSVFF